MTVCQTIDEIKSTIQSFKKNEQTVGFVPTMGALHEGHLQLIKIALKESDKVVVSIFINPTQFGPNEDFNSYPRQLQDDLEKCRDLGVAAVFAPQKDEIYTNKRFLSIQIESLNNSMCGGSRPGFFEGVLLIVNKLFNIVEPDIAVFGQKDIQQFQIISQMVNEFNHPVKLIMGPVVRANDGLALSSRNTYLSREQRKIAPGLYRALSYIRKQIQNGIDTPKLLIEHQRSELEAKGFEIDYLDVFNKRTLQPTKTLQGTEEYIIAGAVYLGKTRLIDNILIEF